MCDTLFRIYNSIASNITITSKESYNTHSSKPQTRGVRQKTRALTQPTHVYSTSLARDRKRTGANLNVIYSRGARCVIEKKTCGAPRARGRIYASARRRASPPVQAVKLRAGASQALIKRTWTICKLTRASI